MMRYMFCFLILLFALPANAENVFYCQTELATGFKKKNNTWGQYSFVKDRYTIKFKNEFTELYGLDESRPYKCVRAWHDPSRSTVNCTSGYLSGEFFNFNIDQKRFLSLTGSDHGYLNNDTDADTNVMRAGTCVKF